MTVLTWDNVEDRLYQIGIDRGVIYYNGSAYAWNGLISVDETKEDLSVTSFYYDGYKSFDFVMQGSFSATIKAYTYPSVLDMITGNEQISDGVYMDNQSANTFGLSYRTLIGDQESGIDKGYKIHVHYNLTIVQDGYSFKTLSDKISPEPFSWKITSLPIRWTDKAPTGHLIFDSLKLSPLELEGWENLLYGTVDTDPSLPSKSAIEDLYIEHG